MTAWLLQEYDEIIWYRSLGFPDMDWSRDASSWDDTSFRPILIGGQRTGIWRRTIGRKAIALDAQLFASLTADEQDALDAAIERFGTYMRLPVTVTYI